MDCNKVEDMIQIVHIPDKTLEKLHKEVGCDWIETQRVSSPLFKKIANFPTHMIIDEEGKLNNKPFNFVASALFLPVMPEDLLDGIIHGRYPIDYIVGNAILCRVIDSDIAGYTKEQCEKIASILVKTFTEGDINE